MVESLVIVERHEDGVHLLKLNRPEKRNALSIELREAVARALNGLAEDPDCRGIVLTGVGSAFCAGMDFTQFGGDRANRLRLLHSTRHLFRALLEFPKPLVGAINGAAVGGGFMVALCCDERLASEGAYFAFYEVTRGIPAPYEIVRLFVEETKAREWCETGRTIEIAEAIDAGIVKELVDGESLMETCRREALRGFESERQVNAAVGSAFTNEMKRFERALFPHG